MTSTPTVTSSPAETDHARELIELGLALDPDVRSDTLARLIAASLHPGPGSHLEHFATTGALDHEGALDELNRLRLPFEQEGWIDALGRHILYSGRSRH